MREVFDDGPSVFAGRNALERLHDCHTERVVGGGSLRVSALCRIVFTGDPVHFFLRAPEIAELHFGAVSDFPEVDDMPVPDGSRRD